MFDGKNFTLIKANRLFAGTVQKLKISIASKELHSAGAGSLIFKQNDDADAVYLVISGEVKLEIPGIFKKPVIVTKSANDFFGEKEYLDRVNRKGSATAATDCQLCVLKKDKLDKLIAQDKRVFANLYGIHDDAAEPGEGFEMDAPVYEPPSEDFLIPDGDDEEIKIDDILLATESDTAEKNNLLEQELNDLSVSDEDFTDEEIKKWTEEIESGAEPAIETGKDIFKEEDEITPSKPSTGENNDDIRVEFDFLKELELIENMPPADDKSSEVINFDLLDEDDLLIGADENDYPVDRIIRTDEITIHTAELIPEIDEEEISEPVIPEDIIIEPEEETEAPFVPDDIKAPENEIAAETDPGGTEDIDELFVRRSDEDISDILSSAELIQTEDELSDIIINEPAVPEIDKHPVIETPVKESPSAAVEEPVAEDKDSNYPNEFSEEVDEMTAAKFKQLLEAAQKINSSIKLDETLESVVAAAKKLTGAEKGYLYLVDRENNELWAKSLNNEIQKETRIKIGDDIPGITAEKGIVINLKDAYRDSRFDQTKDKLEGIKTKSLLSVPILNKTGFVSAVLQLINSSSGEFTRSDEEALGALSVNISLALENAELMERQLQTDRVSSMGKMANFLIQDIKKPVLTIKYYAEHIKKKEVSADVVQILNMLIDQSNAVVDLVQTTLSYSEGKGILKAQPLRLSTVLNDIFNLLAEYVESRHVNLFKKFESDAVVNIDKREFYQACFQIVKNACDAMPKGGDIYVVVKIEEGSIKIEFKDSGVGIPESIKTKIFEPFMTHGKKQGVGLGLSIAEKIVKDHSGEIKFESEIGEGTTFIISLPYISVV